jgi:hypothetical protein
MTCKEMRIFIILEHRLDGDPIITLIQRLRLGPDILPIPAWFNQQEAERYLQRFIKDISENSHVFEVSHTELQGMIDRRQYASGYPEFSTYHLDPQVSESEIDEFLAQFGDE